MTVNKNTGIMWGKRVSASGELQKIKKESTISWTTTWGDQRSGTFVCIIPPGRVVPATRARREITSPKHRAKNRIQQFKSDLRKTTLPIKDWERRHGTTTMFKNISSRKSRHPRVLIRVVEWGQTYYFAPLLSSIKSNLPIGTRLEGE